MSEAPVIQCIPPTPPTKGVVPVSRQEIPSDQAAGDKNNDVNDFYGLRWLFDEDNPDHLSIEDKVKQFKARDLRKTKLFKCAAAVFWAPPSRKRVIIAKSGEQLNRNANAYSSPPADLRPVYATNTPVKSAPTTGHDASSDTVPDPLEYRSWIAERKALRSNLDSIALNEGYLRRKQDRTPMETNVLRMMVAARTPKPKPPIVSKIRRAKLVEIYRCGRRI